jgi:Flp pilus assembly protein TadD
LADGESDRAWAILALAHALLGHHASALHAYRRALALNPGCPEYAHNVGHLLDAGFDRPKDALRYLTMAHKSLPQDVEIAASLAHALLRLGRAEEARQLLTSRLPGGVPAVEELLARWTR